MVMRRISFRPFTFSWSASSLILALGSMSVLAGCDGPKVDTSKLETTLSEINAKQDKIAAKLEELEQKLDKVGKPATPPTAAAGRPDPNETYKVPLEDAAWKGEENALVTIVEWSDFQCPFCNRVGPTIEQLEKEYPGKLKVVFKHNPLSFHNRAMPAAIAAEAAGRQGKFWQMHDKLFANARELTDENFTKWAKEIGLDVKRFEKDLADPKLKEKVENQQKQGVTLGARGTPAFFINGRFLSGAQPVERFKEVIDEELKEAEKLIADGTPKEKVYETVIAKGKTSP